MLQHPHLVTREEIERIKGWLDGRFHRYRLVQTSHGNVPLEILLSVGQFDPSRLDGALPHEEPSHLSNCNDPACGHHVHDHRHDHTEAFSTWSYETDQPLSLEALRETAKKLPATIYRAKGVIYSSDAPTRRAVLQVVGKRVDLSLQDDWGGRPPRTQIVVIGAAGGVDGAILRGQFQKAGAPN